MSIPSVTKPVFEHHHNGFGVGHVRPRISWRFESAGAAVKDWVQTSYDLEITNSSRPDEPKTYHIDGEQSVLVPWPAEALGHRDSATVRVRAYGNNAETPSQWSPPSKVEVSIPTEKDWKANFIASVRPNEHNGPLRPLRFRKSFTLPEEIRRGSTLTARLYITALGVFEVWINGKPVSDEHLAPGWTSYRHRLAYRVLDVSEFISHDQKNVICAEVAEGWYAGRLGFGGGERYRYGDELALFAQLEVRENGKHTSAEPWTLVTDESWTSMTSAITSSEIYDGEVYDLQEEIDDWSLPSTEWPAQRTFGTKIISKNSAQFVAPDAPPVRTTEHVTIKEIFKSKSGKTILDFGQNLVGKLHIPKLDLRSGQKLTLVHAEVMEHGEVGTRPLRVAKCTDTVIGASGKVLENWSPKYTFHGFRYVQIDGWPESDSILEDIVALVIHTDMKRRGLFECSNSFVNQLHSNVVWSMRGNFVSIPTDCPQRDERLGWTGDIQAFCPTAAFLYDTTGMLSSWLEDLSAEQLDEKAKGVVPLVVPEAMPKDWPHAMKSHAIWGDAAILVPQALYDYSADKELLERQFVSMKTWLEQGVVRGPDGFWDPDRFQLGDWLDPNAPPDNPAQATTDGVLVANAYLVHVTHAFTRLCEELGKDQLANEYRQISKKLKDQFQRRYITPDGNFVCITQTGLALALYFGLYPEEDIPRQFAADLLGKLVRKAQFRISTGFAGTPFITHALTSVGHPQLAYRMLLETALPSWMYPVKMGATTIWERWDSMLPDGSINPGEMTSFNHYALGAVADWLHSSVGGISPAEPGWKTIRVRPVPGGNLKSAKVKFDGPYGLVSCEWTLSGADGNQFRMTLTVPPNCTAVVTLPSELRTDYTLKEEISRTVGSGLYEFDCVCDLGQWPPASLPNPPPFNTPLEEDPIAGD